MVAAVLVVINVLRFIFGLTDKSETGEQRQRTIFAIEKLYRDKEQVLGADVLQIMGHALSFGIPEILRIVRIKICRINEIPAQIPKAIVDPATLFFRRAPSPLLAKRHSAQTIFRYS
jgi:hypothetical protein